MACDAAMASPLQVRGLVVRSPAGAAIAAPAFDVAAGGAVALVGPSGCGKSTLLAAALGVLRRPGWTVDGAIAADGEDVGGWPAERRRRWLAERVAFLPQDPHAALDPLQPIGRQIAEATGQGRDECVRMLGWLGVVEPAAVAARVPAQVSGGQAQRALLAIAFLRQPTLCVVDEATAHLDEATAADVTARLQVLQRNGCGVLLATHDARLADALGAAVLRCEDGVFAPRAAEPAVWPVRAPVAGDAPDVLVARDVTAGWRGEPVLQDCGLRVGRGEVVAVVGPSGCGKSTLLRALAGQLPLRAGAVERPSRRAAVQLVAQDAFASLTPGAPLRALLAEASSPGFDVVAAAAALALPAAALDRSREQLSGGERRRAALLRALAVQPEVLLLDEPTASLDRATAIQVVAAALQLRRERGTAIVLATHDLELAAAVADRVFALRGGKPCPFATPPSPR
jgi:peptide/nickel transport system ATP-binding protein